MSDINITRWIENLVLDAANCTSGDKLTRYANDGHFALLSF
jgi:hypothetical protein